jgi:hypothetical protein
VNRSSKDPKGFEGAWTGSFIHHGQPPRTWTYVFENIHENTCRGFWWNGQRHPWAWCVIKDGEISAAGDPQQKTPTVSGRILSSTQLELGWHATRAPTDAERAAGVQAPQPDIHKFVATKQPAGYANTLIDPTQIGGVDRGHMGIYRTLADLMVENMKKGDLVSAAKLGRVLEIAWDRGEEGLHTKSPQVWGGIDAAMDEFVLPVIGYQKAAPDPAKVDAACKVFVAKLKDAETAE